MTDNDHCDYNGCTMLGHFTDPGLEGKWCQHHRRKMRELTTESRIAVLEVKLKQVKPLLEAMVGHSLGGYEWQAVCEKALKEWRDIVSRMKQLEAKAEEYQRKVDLWDGKIAKIEKVLEILLEED